MYIFFFLYVIKLCGGAVYFYLIGENERRESDTYIMGRQMAVILILNLYLSKVPTLSAVATSGTKIQSEPQ